MNDTVPIQYERGWAEFMGMRVKVDPRVLIPRPETELLVRKVVELTQEKGKNCPRILDIGTGSGVIPLGIMQLAKKSEIIAADISEEALEVAAENLRTFNCQGKVKLVQSDIFSSFDETYENFFDCIVSNPPYVSKKDYEKLDPWVKAEPRAALYAGEEGMDLLNVIISDSGRLLTSGGFLAVEIGYDQAEKVKRAFLRKNFTDISSFKDFNGYERVVAGFYNG